MLRALMLAAKVAVFFLALGGLGLALLARELGAWVFGVFPGAVLLGTIILAVSRSMRLRAEMRAVDDELHESSAALDRA